MAYVIHLEKENFKFSGTHFTIFSPTEAERLHGHNYQVKVGLEVAEVDPHLGMAFDFNLVKPIIKQVCDRLDEYVLVPAKSPYVKVKSEGAQVGVEFAGKIYSFPASDVRLLPLVNMTSEELASYVAQELQGQLKAKLKYLSLTVTVEESRGQSVSLTLKG